MMSLGSALLSAGTSQCRTNPKPPATDFQHEHRRGFLPRKCVLSGSERDLFRGKRRTIDGGSLQSCRSRVGGGVRVKAITANSEEKELAPEGIESTSLTVVPSSPEYEALIGAKVVRVVGGEEVELLSLLDGREGQISVVVFLTHFADLSSWELAQKLVKKVIPALDSKNISLIAVGLGSPENASMFAEIHKFPLDRLYADPDGTCYSALGFARGAFPEASLSPYLKLLAMLAGIESPGTIPEVIRGYVGDRSSKPVFDGSSPFDILGTQYQRPFELATLRLLNMVGILPRWGDLSPPKTELLTQQGGTLVFRGKTVVFQHKDTGILKYVDTAKLLELFNE